MYSNIYQSMQNCKYCEKFLPIHTCFHSYDNFILARGDNYPKYIGYKRINIKTHCLS